MFALGSAFLLTSFAGSTDWMLRRQLRQEENRILDDTADLLLSICRQNQNLAASIRDEIPRDLRALHYHNYQLKILDGQGRLMAETKDFPPVSKEDLQRLPGYIETKLVDGAVLQSGTQTFLAVRSQTFHPNPVAQQPQTELSFVLALDITRDQNTLIQYRRFLYLSVFLGASFAAVLAFWSTHQGLGPLRRLTRQVELISLDQLHQRFSQQQWPQELVPLAGEFDRLLDEVERGLASASHFSSNLAHELRTPLAALMLEAELALSRTQTTDEYQAVIASSQEELERLSTLVERLLLLARTDSAKPYLEMSVVNVLDVVQRLADYHLSALDDGQVIVSIPVSAQIRTDQGLLEIALGNLLSNAAKYAHPPIRVTWSLTASYASLAVEDSGPGIAVEHRPFIFDRLYRAELSRTDSNSHGLGLALVRSAAHTLELEGVYTALEGASRFELRFPLLSVVCSGSAEAL